MPPSPYGLISHEVFDVLYKALGFKARQIFQEAVENYDVPPGYPALTVPVEGICDTLRKNRESSHNDKIRRETTLLMTPDESRVMYRLTMYSLADPWIRPKPESPHYYRPLNSDAVCIVAVVEECKENGAFKIVMHQTSSISWNTGIVDTVTLTPSGFLRSHLDILSPTAGRHQSDTLIVFTFHQCTRCDATFFGTFKRDPSRHMIFGDLFYIGPNDSAMHRDPIVYSPTHHVHHPRYHFHTGTTIHPVHFRCTCFTAGENE